MTVAATQLPVFGQYPAGVSVKSGIEALLASGTSTSTTGPVDVVDIRSRMTKTFTAAAGDSFSVGKLFSGTAPSGGSIAGYKVALRADGANGKLTLDGQDVSTRGSFTADEFSRLQFTAGPSGSDDLVVVAQGGTRLPNGSLVNEVDSPAVQITANVTGSRSINAAGALLTDPTGDDGAFVTIARQASIFTGFGAARPSLATVGNLTAAAGDSFSVGKLFSGTAPSGGSIAGYKVALRADGANGKLTLDGQDVSTKGSFTADEFSRLQFTAGPSGSDDLVVVAQGGTRLPNGSLVNEVDSPAVQITANVTGSRSINAAGALLTDPTGDDGAFVTIARQASIFTGFGAARPSLATVGNLTAAAGDSFSVGKLFSGTAPSGGSIAGYKVALRADGANGKLTLDGQDVSTKGSFTADEFSRLQFTAGPSGSDDLVVVAQGGTRLPNGSLVNEVDSPAVQITANVTGSRSINAAGALLTDPTGDDGAFVTIARQASIFTGFGAARPSLATVGNLTAAAGDSFSVGKLFSGTAPSGGSIAGYKVALRADGANGKLTLDGQDVSTRGSFTADEFSRLQFTAGPSGSDDLVVVAQGGTRLPNGSLVNEVDSPAVQITANVTGSRSINAAGALLTDPTGDDGAFVTIARQASIFTGFGAARPSLATVGNLTAAAGDSFSVGKLFSGTAPSGGSIAGYKVALRADGANGKLTLDGQDVSTKGSFTADEFSRLQFTAGPSGSDDLVVVAQGGTRLPNGSLVNEVDSPAVQITANVTGSRSINAAGALLTDPTGDDGAFVTIARQASIFTGFGATRPSLANVGIFGEADTVLTATTELLGAFQSSEQVIGGSPELEDGFLDTVGQSISSASSAPTTAQQALDWILAATELGGFQASGSTTALQRLATAAYRNSTTLK